VAASKTRARRAQSAATRASAAEGNHRAAPAAAPPTTLRRISTGDEGIGLLLRGCPAIKYGRSGKPHAVVIRLSNDQRHLTWEGSGLSKLKVKADRREVALEGVREMQIGRESEVFRRQLPGGDGYGQAHLSLSLAFAAGASSGTAPEVGSAETVAERLSLDISFENEEHFGLVIAAIRLLCARAGANVCTGHPGSGAIDAGHATGVGFVESTSVYAANPFGGPTPGPWGAACGPSDVAPSAFDFAGMHVALPSHGGEGTAAADEHAKWQAVSSEVGNYYYNPSTGETTWQLPGQPESFVAHPASTQAEQPFGGGLLGGGLAATLGPPHPGQPHHGPPPAQRDLVDALFGGSSEPPAAHLQTDAFGDSSIGNGGSRGAGALFSDGGSSGGGVGCGGSGADALFPCGGSYGSGSAAGSSGVAASAIGGGLQELLGCSSCSGTDSAAAPPAAPLCGGDAFFSSPPAGCCGAGAASAPLNVMNPFD